jgi:phage portal protein BeeE
MKKTPLDMSFFERFKASAQVLTGKTPSWMGPGEPVAPMVPASQEDAGNGLKGRKNDYGVGVNLSQQTKTTESGFDYQTLRMLGNQDLVRTCIEKRKDQISRMKWRVVYKNRKYQRDRACEKIEAQLKHPYGAGNHATFHKFIREIVEDVLVLDTIAIEKLVRNDGSFRGFRQIDPTTVKKLIDNYGCTPEAPEAAYQQLIKGQVTASFTTDEMFVNHKNGATNRVYGFSPVEQIALTINLAMRRLTAQNSYFLDSNMPAAMLGMPSEFTMEDIQDWDAYANSKLAGNQAERSKLFLVPGEAKFIPMKESPLKTELDEWIARVIYSAFALPPQGIVKEMNRNSSETSVESSKEDGMGALLAWLKDEVMDPLLQYYVGAEDMEFVWEEEEAVDPLKQAQIHEIYGRNLKCLTTDEIREALGKAPLTEEQKKLIEESNIPKKEVKQTEQNAVPDPKEEKPMGSQD